MAAISRRGFLQATAGLAAAGLDFASAPAFAEKVAPAARLNIVHFVVHDLGRYIEPYGAPVETPNLAAFARQALVLRNAHCASPCCMPSRSCAMSGLYAHRSGMLGTSHGWSLRGDIQTVVDHLNQAGYETALAGLQHERAATAENRNPDRYKVVMNKHGACVENAVDDAIGYLRARKGGDAPFYLNIGTRETHASLLTPPFYLKQGRREVYGVDKPGDVRVPDHLPDNAKSREYLAKWVPMVRHLDRHFGRLVQELDKLPLAGNTLVLFSVDHGIWGARHKSTLYGTGTEISAMFRLPGKIAPGGWDVPIANVDFCPTLLAAAGVAAPVDIDGRSFWQNLTSGSAPTHDHIFLERNFHTNYDPTRGVRTERYLYLRNYEPQAHHAYCAPEIMRLPPPVCNTWPNDPVFSLPQNDPKLAKFPPRGREELFDLQADPRETRNVVHDAEFEKTRAELAALLDGWMRNTHDPLLAGAIPIPDGIDYPWHPATGAKKGAAAGE
jgi:arylsulfatase A-like enzyme